ncbi:MAG: NAD(P)-dependent alcohol dehydrogenase, partial [Candidatus Dormibacteraeota bacterium]|nr:NAD(P)-dependent alcohol dehydrogenase [Candidatus Dormibacteraeota bacterium]
RPGIRDREVLIRVRAAGVDRSVWHVMTGRPYLIRLVGFGLRPPKAGRVLGSEVAGEVVEVGPRVTRVRPGDEVMGTCDGSFAEYASAREDRLARRPSNVTIQQAATAGISAITALQALRDQGRVAAGQRVLIAGASGGVGTFAVQLAKVFGAEVTGVCSTSKVDLVRSLGADRVIDYTRGDITDDGRPYDLILDIGGNRPLSLLRSRLAPRGTLVMVGGEGGGRWSGMGRQLQAVAISPVVRQRLRVFIANANHKDLETLRELIEAGKLTPVLDRTYPLDEAPEAIRYLEAGRARGKVVVTVP